MFKSFFLTSTLILSSFLTYVNPAFSKEDQCTHYVRIEFQKLKKRGIQIIAQVAHFRGLSLKNQNSDKFLILNLNGNPQAIKSYFTHPQEITIDSSYLMV